MHRCLRQSDSSGKPHFEDQEALSLVSDYIDHEISKLDDLSERTRNQTSVLFSLISRADTKASIELTEESKRLTAANLEIARAAKEDSGAMKTISTMTMLFLPATYFAALFSMPTLQWNERSVVRDRFWVYWAFTIPTTCGVFFVWAVANRLRLMRQAQGQREPPQRERKWPWIYVGRSEAL